MSHVFLVRGYFVSCWHKLFCKKDSVSNGVSLFVLIQSYYFALGGVATERILYCKGNNLSSSDHKVLY